MARPTSFNLPIAKRISDMIAQGHTREHAAFTCNVEPRTVQNWYNRGKRGEAPFVEFFRLLRAADAKWESELLVALQTAERALGNVMWRLERDKRTRARWGPRNRFEDVDREQSHNLAPLSDEELEQVERTLRKAKTA